MNEKSLTARHLGLAFSAMGLALLTACGGGGGGDAAPTGVATQAAVESFANLGAAQPEAVAAQDVAQPAVQKLCGIDAVPTTEPFSFYTPASATMVINAYTTPIALLTSLSGYPFSSGSATSLSLAMPDLREVAALGLNQTTNNRMGVEVSSPFAAGSVACVAGITRVLPGTDLLGNPIDLVSVSSSTVTNLPVEVQIQTGQPALRVINGFEFMHNLSGQNANAVFRVSSFALANPSAARICHIASSITCETADSISSEGGDWVLRKTLTQGGVYVLAAEREIQRSE